MRFEIFVALKHLTARRRGLLAWITTGIAGGGVALGVTALVTTLAVVTGFRSDIQKRILGISPHVVIIGSRGNLSDKDRKVEEVLQKVPEVIASTPFILSQTLLRRGSQTLGVDVLGINPGHTPPVTPIRETLVRGSWDRVIKSKGDIPGLVLGKDVADGLRARIGDSVLAVSPGDYMMGSLLPIPKVMEFELVGIVETGFYNYDAKLAVVSLESAQELFGMSGKVSAYGIRTKKLEYSEPVATELQVLLGRSYRSQSWLTMNQALFSALKLEKVLMFLLIALITLVAAFTIVSNLLLLTVQKASEIGIMRAIGATSSHIRRIFLLEGCLIGGIGAGVGVFGGLILCSLLKRYQFIKLPADVYYIDTIPVLVLPTDILLVVLVSGLIVLLATLYPAIHASKMNPLDAIRYG